ncbi:hypothetical protein MMC07_009229 [Pseudocyphellaria aurata]|nr:hypothetical protein [Pseudocyphellaria aurata]
MARRQQNDYMPTAQDVPRSNGLPLSSDRPTMADEEPVSEVDEPPDEKMHFPRLVIPNNKISPPGYTCNTTPSLQHNGNPSLLTQALLTTPDLTPWSDTEAPLLTSDGGLTSPSRTNTPSPPLPAANVSGLALPPFKVYAKSSSRSDIETAQLQQDNETTEKPVERSVEAGLGRRRCITFACGRQNGTSTSTNSKPADHSVEISSPVASSKRQCTLRFACPTKPSLDTIRQTEQHKQQLEPPQLFHHQLLPKTCTLVPSTRHRDSLSNLEKRPKTEEITGLGKPSVLDRPDLELSEATRFHEFAGPFNVDDEWMNEQTAHRQKITVNDTLRKENAIRKLAQEADEEALEDDEQGVSSLGNDDDDDDDNFDSDEEVSDAGNETDDEEGFADSDVDSEHGSHYHFWTPGLTTAATSVDQIEHPRPWTHRLTSESSIESMINTREKVVNHNFGIKRACKSQRTQTLSKMWPGTPNLPDSTDFVCGTLDEDRPLEAAYMSCLEERRRSKHKTIPQDIDPSFPTSDPDAEEDDDDVDDDDNATQTSDEQVWVMGRLDNLVDEDQPTKSKRDVSRRVGKSPMPSPKRPRSPAPLRRGAVHRSPPPRRLFGQSPSHLRSPYTVHQLKSPPSTRRTSFCISPRQKSQGITTSNLAQRPHLTHTTSLPRTPNPFWTQHREARDYGSGAPSGIGPAITADHCSRGPIDIVKGLESRRQRRKEKLWRQHCRYAARDKDRKCQPGKGAERMRELGLELANKVRDYGQKAALVLSV